MRTIIVLSFILTCFFSAPYYSKAQPNSLLWDKYLHLAQQAETQQAEIKINYSLYPGKIFVEENTDLFTSNWKYRNTTYEIFFASKQKLGRTVYDLAIFTGDIPVSTSLERVEAGVEGFHYSIDQICSWLNSVFYKTNKTPAQDTFTFISYLLQDEVVQLKNGVFVPSKMKHVLAAAQGRKRSLEQNLKHERLHVYWDEDTAFKETAQQKWNNLSQDEKNTLQEKLKQYSNNEEVRLEEWAVREAEKNAIPVEGF